MTKTKKNQKYVLRNGLLLPVRPSIAKALDSTATFNPILTALAIQFIRDTDGFVAEELFPSFPTAMQAGNYYTFQPSELAQIPVVPPRAPGTAYPRLKQKLSNDNYSCQDYGIEGPMPDEDRAKYASFFDADQVTIHRVIDTIRINREQRAYNIATGAGVNSAAVGVHWNDGSSNPKADTDAAREQIRLNCGLLPNTLIITQPTLNALSQHPLIKDVFKFTSAGVMDEQKIAGYFQIPKVKIAKSVIATNNEGQAFSPADIWGNTCVLAHVNPTPDLQAPNFGRTFFWTAFTSEVNMQTGGTGPAMTTGGGGPELIRISSYRDETVKSDIHRSEHYVGEKLTAPLAGYCLTGLLG